MISLQSTFLERAREHVAAGNLEKGRFGIFENGFRGCSIGCHLHDLVKSPDEFESAGNPYRTVANHYGYPEWLARLQHYIFERLPANEGLQFHIDFAAAVTAHNRQVGWASPLHRFHADILALALPSAGQSKDILVTTIQLHLDSLTSKVEDHVWTRLERESGAVARSLEWDPQDILTWNVGAAVSAARAAEQSSLWLEEASAGDVAAEYVRLSAQWLGDYFVEPETIRDILLTAMGFSGDGEVFNDPPL